MKTSAAHTKRHASIVKALRACAPKGDSKGTGWHRLSFPKVKQEVFVHVVSQDFLKENLFVNEVWLRVGSKELRDAVAEYRGSAEVVATSLLRNYLSTTPKVQALAQDLHTKVLNSSPKNNTDRLKAPELAAMFDLDEEMTFKALDFLAEAGIVSPAMSGNDFIGWDWN